MVLGKKKLKDSQSGKRFCIVGTPVKVCDDGMLLVENKDGSKLKIRTHSAESILEKHGGRKMSFFGVWKGNGQRVLLSVRPASWGINSNKSKARRMKAWSEVHSQNLEDARSRSGKHSIGLNQDPMHVSTSKKTREKLLVAVKPVVRVKQWVEDQGITIPEFDDLKQERKWWSRMIAKQHAETKRSTS